MCRNEQYEKDLLEATRGRPSRRLKAIADAARDIVGDADQSDAARDFRRIMDLNAQDVLALKETWTDKDTEILRHLNASRGAWTGNAELTTEGVRSQLPSLQSLEDIVSGGRVAIVGGGGSLRGRGLGEGIDEHGKVFRFNDFSINDADTGSRTSFQVLNKNVRGLPDLPVFDLEAWSLPHSLCARLRRKGEFATDEAVYLFRPSARCGMGDLVNKFTRGFLFYWLVGTLFEHVDLYGFAVSSGRSHYAPGKGDVGEAYLEFEHKFYEQLAHRLRQEGEAPPLQLADSP